MLKCFVECELLCDAWDLGTVDAFLDSASSCLWNPRYFSQMLRRVSESHGSCSISGNSSESGNQAVPPLTLPVWPFAGLGWVGGQREHGPCWTNAPAGGESSSRARFVMGSLLRESQGGGTGAGGPQVPTVPLAP